MIAGVKHEPIIYKGTKQMKKIIEGKRYNTETAEKIHAWDNGHYGGDFKACEETLYKTKNGSYFIHGSGGPMSPYAKPVGNNAVGYGSDIIPMSKEEAFEWLTGHDGEEAAEEEFPDMIQDA
jgi:hypothetical protein